MNNLDSEVDPSTIPDAPTNGDYSNWDKSTQPADPNYQTNDNDLVAVDLALGSTPSQSSLYMPEDLVDGNLTTPQAISTEDDDVTQASFALADEIFSEPYEDEFVFGRDKMAGIKGVNSKDLGLIVGQLTIPTAPQTTENTQNVAGMYGSHWLGNNYGAKQFDIPVTIIAGDNQDKYLAALESIASAFISKDNVEHSIQFGAYPGRTYFGHFTQLPTFTFINPGMFDAQGTLTFMASDPKGYLDQRELNFTSTPYTFMPEGNTSTAPIIHFEFLKDVYNFGFLNSNGEKVFVGYDQSQQAPDLEPVVYKDLCNDPSTFKRLTIADKLNYSIAWGTPSTVSGVEPTETNQALKMTFFDAVQHPFDNSNQSYGTALQTPTFSTKVNTPNVTNGHAWQVDVNFFHEKFYPKSQQRIEAYLIGEDGTRLGRFGITDWSTTAFPKIYLLFGSSVAKEEANLARGFGYRGIGNTPYAVSQQQTKIVGHATYTPVRHTTSVYKFAQSITRTTTTETYNRTLSSTQARKLGKVVNGVKYISTKTETAKIGYKYDNFGNIIKSSNGGYILYDDVNGNPVTWISGPRKGNFLTTKDFDTTMTQATLNAMYKVSNVIEMTNLSWIVKGNSQKKVSVPLNSIKRKPATRRLHARTESKQLNYHATRTIVYQHNFYTVDGKKSKLTSQTLIATYYGSGISANTRWTLRGRPKVKVAVDRHSPNQILRQTTNHTKNAVTTLVNQTNTQALTTGLLAFRVRQRGNDMIFQVHKADPWSGIADPKKLVVSTGFRLPNELAGLALNQLTIFAGKRPLPEDILDANKKPLNPYKDDNLAFSGLQVKKLLNINDFDMPKIIAHKGDTADINIGTEDVFINGRLANNLRSIDSTFPTMTGGKEETLSFMPDVTGANITGIYRPAII